MRVNSGQLFHINLSQIAYYSNEPYQESAGRKGRILFV